MTDMGIIAAAAIILIAACIFVFRDVFIQRIKSGGGFDAGFKLPFGIGAWAKLPESEKKSEVAEKMGLPLPEVEKLAEPNRAEVSWKRDKVADIYWLGSDLMSTLGIMRDGRPEDILVGLRQIFWHSEVLSLDPVITGRLKKLYEVARTLSSWDMQNRGQINAELVAVWSAVNLFVEAADPDFRPNRPT